MFCDLVGWLERIQRRIRGLERSTRWLNPNPNPVNALKLLTNKGSSANVFLYKNNRHQSPKFHTFWIMVEKWHWEPEIRSNLKPLLDLVVDQNTRRFPLILGLKTYLSWWAVGYFHTLLLWQVFHCGSALFHCSFPTAMLITII